MSDKEQQSKPPTPEQLEARKKELMAFYKQELPLLRLQSEYETLVTSIEVAKMQRLEIMIARSQMMNGPEDAQQPGKEKDQDEVMRPINPNIEN